MKQFNKLNIIFCGIGGQGIVSLAKLTHKILFIGGYEVKCFDVMGLGQRGGSVSSHLRFSKEKILSPLIPVGQVDYLVGLEQTEVLRNIHYLSTDGYLVASDYKLTSPSVNAGLERDTPYTVNDVCATKKIKKTIFYKNILESENISYVNLNFSLLSILLCLLDYDLESAKETIKTIIPQNRIQENILAFEKGIDYFKKQA